MNTIVPKFRGHDFSRTAKLDIQRSLFDRSHGHKTTLDGGFLVPIFVDEALPGDSWKLTASQLCRMTTPIVPFMDNVRASWFFFSVPKRLVWDNFESFITGSEKGKVGTTHTSYPFVEVFPESTEVSPGEGWFSGSLFDYFGIPCPVAGKSLKVNALPLRAYNLIWNEWFRDENLQDCVNVSTSDLEESQSNYRLLRRGKRHDYFTSALPWLQKGPAVSLSLGGSAPVIGNGSALGLDRNLSGVDTGGKGHMVNNHSIGLDWSQTVDYTDGVGLSTDPNRSGVFADLSSSTAITINSLREMFAVQHLLERDARGGSRYVESLLSHFGVQSPDFRLQRPEYLGGGVIDFQVNSVAQTSASTTDTPQGNLAAVAKGVGTVGFNASFVEHSIVIGLICIHTDLTYQQGLNRMWTRKVRTEEYWPEFAHLGEQPVYEREIFATGDPAIDDRVFGYQERYSEYRYKPSMITGKLRSTASGSLDVWHLAQVFADAPSLSSEFIEEHPPFERVLAVQNEPQFVLDAWFNFQCIRPLPMFGTPSLLDHF